MRQGGKVSGHHQGSQHSGMPVCLEPDLRPFGVWGLGFRVQGLGFRVQGLGFRVQGLGFRV